jgi:hypothetical protein
VPHHGRALDADRVEKGDGVGGQVVDPVAAVGTIRVADPRWSGANAW